MTIDTDRFRGALLKQKEQLVATIANHDIGGASLTDETGELSGSTSDNHLADSATETYERELDEGIEEDAVRQLREMEEALERIEAGTYGICEVCGQGDPRGTAGGGPVDEALHRRRPEAAALTEPARRESPRPLDVRVGSSTNALRPISSAERSLAAGRRQWLGLGSIAVAALFADQLTKQIVSARSRSGRRCTSPGRSRSTTCGTPASRSGSSPTRPRS